MGFEGVFLFSVVEKPVDSVENLCLLTVAIIGHFSAYVNRRYVPQNSGFCHFPGA